jgi:hypothetical protein
MRTVRHIYLLADMRSSDRTFDALVSGQHAAETELLLSEANAVAANGALGPVDAGLMMGSEIIAAGHEIVGLDGPLLLHEPLLHEVSQRPNNTLAVAQAASRGL